MALVGNISGSGGTSNTVGITGSLIIANPGINTFPSFPGSDVTLFVSGNISAKPSSSPDYSVRGTTVFGGDVVISGTLFGGSPLYIGSPITASAGFSIPSTTAFIADGGLTGSLQQTAGGVSYLVAGSNITIVSQSNGQVRISSTAAGGGGSGANFFYDTDGNAKVYTTGSVAFVGTGADYSNNIFSPTDKGTDLFFYVSGSTAAGSDSALFGGRLITSGTIAVKDSFGRPAVSLGNAGVISGSGAIFVGGDINVAGDIVADTAESKTIFGTIGANTLTLGQNTSTVAVAGNLDTNGTANIAGAITLDGAGAQTITQTGTGDLTITSTNGQVIIEGTAFDNNNVTIAGNLTVRGTTVAVDTTNLRVKDPIVLIGSGSNAADSKSVIAFASGSSGGTNSLVFGAAGVVGGNFLAAAQADVQDGAIGIGSLSLTNYVPVRASAFQLGGIAAAASSFASSSLGTDLILSGTTGMTLGSSLFSFQRTDTTFLTLNSNAPLNTIQINAGGSGFTTANVLNTIVTTLNLAGAGTDISIGSTSGNAYIKNATLWLSGNVVAAGDISVNGGDITTSASTFNLVNGTATTVNFAGAATNVGIGASGGLTVVSGSLTVNGNTTLGDATTDTVTYTARAASNFLPSADVTYDLGSPALRWKNMYTGDLHLRNDRGSWTIIEEADYLSITNNLDGRRYKFVLQEI